MLRHLRRLDEHLPAPPVVIDIVCNEDLFEAVLGAVLDHVDAVVLKDDLRVGAAIARRADRDRDVVEEIGSRSCRHD
jgi:hypothetical protein